MSPVNTDTSFIENRAPNVAVQFRDRVHKSPEPRGVQLPGGGRPAVDVDDLEGDR